MSRILLLLPTKTYRTAAFLEAARNVGADIIVASEEPSTLESANPQGLLTLDFLDLDALRARVREFARTLRIDAVIPVDEDTAVAAACVADELGIENHSIESTLIAKNKHRMREVLRQADVPVPRFWHFPGALPEESDSNSPEALDALAPLAGKVEYPCVVKPVFLSTSRGVMRADNPDQFAAAAIRLAGIVSRPELRRRGGRHVRDLLVEAYVPGFEVALEAILTDERLTPLALFDKPDPLEGPFFEETIYVTPSRLAEDARRSIVEATSSACRAMGLTRGPVHAELRINDEGPWIIEVAARAIGGQCARTLRFGPGMSLEELILRHALNEDISGLVRENRAAAVMMIPVPRGGTLRAVKGLDKARSVQGIEDIAITAHTGQLIQPPPEGASYLGFIFSRGERASQAEAAVRKAHGYLRFLIE